MKRRRVGCVTGGSVALLVVIAFVGWFLCSDFMTLDRCLDAGGRWADGGYCDGEPVGA
ncbi:hypothetical protein [Brevundimonas sp.]|uniref:hypothetical protein n=1 Tax=Brevundimonas sp. TaxID=1871086 RepID=UPI0039E43E0F